MQIIYSGQLTTISTPTNTQFLLAGSSVPPNQQCRSTGGKDEQITTINQEAINNKQ